MDFEESFNIGRETLRRRKDFNKFNLLNRFLFLQDE